LVPRGYPAKPDAAARGTRPKAGSATLNANWYKPPAPEAVMSNTGHAHMAGVLTLRVVQ
jgi:hypothetical protein